MSKGRFGIHGGQYIPETLMNAVIELEEAYNHYKDDPEFNAELTELLNEYAGRPSRLYFASHMTEDLGGAKVYLKRYRRSQNQQCTWSGTSCQKNGQDPRDRRNRRRPARCGNSNSSSSYGYGM